MHEPVGTGAMCPLVTLSPKWGTSALESIDSRTPEAPKLTQRTPAVLPLYAANPVAERSASNRRNV